MDRLRTLVDVVDKLVDGTWNVPATLSSVISLDLSFLNELVFRKMSSEDYFDSCKKGSSNENRERNSNSRAVVGR
jgi:hypothetical protein